MLNNIDKLQNINGMLTIINATSRGVIDASRSIIDGSRVTLQSVAFMMVMTIIICLKYRPLKGNLFKIFTK